MLVQSEGNPVGGSFRVASMGGSIVTEGDFRGSWLIVWFVDPRCPSERCYPALRRLDETVMALRTEGRSVTPLVVSLETGEMDLDDWQAYVTHAAPHILPFYASYSMIKAMTALYHAPFKQEAGYYIPAPNFVVMNPQGRYAGSLSTDLGQAELLEHFHAFMMPR
nr:SCO family protein [Saccharibacter sp. 17.LH.SD]